MRIHIVEYEMGYDGSYIVLATDDREEAVKVAEEQSASIGEYSNDSVVVKTWHHGKIVDTQEF